MRAKIINIHAHQCPANIKQAVLIQHRNMFRKPGPSLKYQSRSDPKPHANGRLASFDSYRFKCSHQLIKSSIEIKMMKKGMAILRGLRGGIDLNII